MRQTHKLLLIYSNERPLPVDDLLDLPRLKEALRARGAEIKECTLGSNSDVLLDLIEEGAVPVVF
jgi:hypothetical protein